MVGTGDIGEGLTGMCSCHISTLRSFSYSDDESFALMLLSTASTDNDEGMGARPETTGAAGAVALVVVVVVVVAAGGGCGEVVVAPAVVVVKVKGFVPLPPMLAPLLLVTVAEVLFVEVAAGGRPAVGAAFSSSLEDTRSSTTG